MAQLGVRFDHHVRCAQVCGADYGAYSGRVHPAVPRQSQGAVPAHGTEQRTHRSECASRAARGAATPHLTGVFASEQLSQAYVHVSFSHGVLRSGPLRVGPRALTAVICTVGAESDVLTLATADTTRARCGGYGRPADSDDREQHPDAWAARLVVLPHQCPCPGRPLRGALYY